MEGRGRRCAGGATLCFAIVLGEGGREEIGRGVVGRYRSLVAEDAGFTRIDARPALSLGRGSPHPRLPAGPFTATWSGVLEVSRAESLRISAFVGGEVAVRIGGVEVLHGRGGHDAARVDAPAAVPLDRGRHPLRIEFRALENVGARLQLWWEGDTFAFEPIPTWRFGHRGDELTPSDELELEAARGREAAGRLGCARCHAGALPAVDAPPPGPSLVDAGQRVSHSWLMEWLSSPRAIRPGARMPELFAPDRTGFVERWLVADALLATSGRGAPPDRTVSGDHRAGRQSFLGLGCAACHLAPDGERAQPPDPDRFPIERLADRMSQEQLARFLVQPAVRYPDGRMPQLPMTLEEARAVAAYLLVATGRAIPVPPSVPQSIPPPPALPPDEAEIERVAASLRVARFEVGQRLLKEKGCGGCHAGLPDAPPVERPIADTARAPRGCLSDRSDRESGASASGAGGNPIPRFALDDSTRRSLAAYLAVAPREIHASSADARRRLLERSGCARCHRRDSDRPAPLEAIGPTLWTPMLYRLPFQKTPPLTNALTKYTRDHLTASIRDGVAGVRPSWYSYRMPAFGPLADSLVQALAEADGDLVDEPPPPRSPPLDPTLASAGPELVGFSGYSCVSCHLWSGNNLTTVDPAAVGPELTTVTQRIRRDWFDRWLDDPVRIHPGTAMPSLFRKGEPASVRSLLAGDVARQKEAIWRYLALGRAAPAPRPRPPIAIAPPADGAPRVAQIPVRLEGGALVESICILSGDGDLALIDIGRGALRNVYVGARILRHPNGGRGYALAGRALLPEPPPALAPAIAPAIAPAVAPAVPPAVAPPPAPPPAFELVAAARQPATAVRLRGFERLADGARVDWRVEFGSVVVELAETFRLVREDGERRLLRELATQGVPAGARLETRGFTPSLALPDAVPEGGPVAPAASAAPPPTQAVDTAYTEGALERPGYRAIRWPRPQTASGEDLVMPAAVAVDPRSGRVFVASMKLGELFEAIDPDGSGANARFEDFARGLFQDALALDHDGAALHVLHRRNLTRVTDVDGDGKADRFERLAALPHAIADAYDWGYGLARDRDGAFLLSLACYGDPKLPGAAAVLRCDRTDPARIGAEVSANDEIAWGLRNPLGWCNGPGGEPFFTDNQGEWVATNKLCHVDAGRYYGWPNPARSEQRERKPENACVWIPYEWAKSVNGVAFDSTGGGFGPFAGQLFLAELMHGGALLRANVEQVKGVWQGACFPFWGKGLLGPVCLAFDPRGALYVGGITTPGWMGQPDRGAFHRIEFTGEVPFEIRSLHARPDGFRVLFTRPVEPLSALDPASWRVERHHYEYTGAYGSPELDRTALPIESLRLAADGCEVQLSARGLMSGWVHVVSAAGVRSQAGETLVHPSGAYTLNELPDS